MPDDSVGANLSFLHKKMEIGGRTEPLGSGGLNEQSPDAHVLDAGQITVSIALPVDPDTGA